MRLFEHQDFEQAVLQPAEYFRGRGLRPAVIEKDYHVTEALPIITAMGGDKIIFKGGTSLSKGWNLIQRFSEDIDIFLDPAAFEPALGKRAIDRELKKLRDSIGGHPALTFLERESQTIGGFGRSDRFSYEQHFGGAGEVAAHVLLEAGTASGREPIAVVELRSYLGQSLHEKGMSLGAEDEGAFSMRLLHFRRTFVEKLLRSIAKWNCSSAMRGRSARMHATTTTCSSLPDRRRLPRCLPPRNTPRSRLTTMKSAGPTSCKAISILIR